MSTAYSRGIGFASHALWWVAPQRRQRRCPGRVEIVSRVGQVIATRLVAAAAVRFFVQGVMPWSVE
jgi:hypothetical protein